MGCSVRVNRHGYLAFRLYFDAMESHEGTKLKATSENRRRVAERASVIDQEMRDGVFDYLKWFPTGNLAERFRPQETGSVGRTLTLRRFFHDWSGPHASSVVSVKWRRNRASYIRTHVLPVLGALRMDELSPRHLVDLQTRLTRKRLAPSTIDRAIHSALRGMLRDAEIAGYGVPHLDQLFDSRFVKRLDQGSDTLEIDPYTDQERDRILAWFFAHRRSYYSFVYFRFWTGTRPSEAIALRWKDIDLRHRRLRIRRSRVLGADSKPKTGRSKRDVLLHEELVRLLHERIEDGPSPEAFVFTTPSGTSIDAANSQRREWLVALRALGIRPRPFYNTRHTYISALLAAGAKPLFVCRQTGTSLEMIEKHYGDARVNAEQLDELIRRTRAPSAPKFAIP